MMNRYELHKIVFFLKSTREDFIQDYQINDIEYDIMFYRFYNNLISNIETIYEEILKVEDMAKVVYLQVLQDFIRTLEENKQEKLKYILDKQFIFWYNVDIKERGVIWKK